MAQRLRAEALLALDADDSSGWTSAELLMHAMKSITSRVWRNASGCWVIRVFLSEAMALCGLRLADVQRYLLQLQSSGQVDTTWSAWSYGVLLQHPSAWA